MSEEKPSPELDYDEQKSDLDDKNDNYSYSNGSNSKISVCGHHQNRIHHFMIASLVVLTCLLSTLFL